MKHVAAMGVTTNAPRPAVFLAGECPPSDDWQRKIRVLFEETERGTLITTGLDGAERPDGYTLWCVERAWMADIVAVWFRPGPAQIETAFICGQHLARYSLGAGPRRLVIGASSDYMGNRDVRAQFDAAMARIAPEWKIQFNNDMDSFADNLKQAIQYALTVGS